MKEIELRSLDLNVEKIEDDILEVQGYIASDSFSHVLGQKENKKWRETITPGVFNEALSKARRLGQDIDFLVDHNDKQILASTTNDSLFLEEDETGLYINAKISPTSWGKDLFILVKDRIIKGLSFGMRVLRDNWTQTSDGIPLRTILEIDLFEISALKTAAYPTTLLEARGLEVVDIEIPNDIEKRGLGDNEMDEEDVIKPSQFYNGLVLIAEKLDLISEQIVKINIAKTDNDLEEAKKMLADTKAVVEAVSKLKNAEAVAKGMQEENKVNEKRGLEEAKEAVPSAEDEKNDKDKNIEDEAKILKDENIDGEDNIKNEDKADDLEDVTKTKTEVKENNNKEQPNIEEYRSLLNKFKVEVPNIE